jgi:hypothetical protein
VSSNQCRAVFLFVWVGERVSRVWCVPEAAEAIVRVDSEPLPCRRRQYRTAAADEENNGATGSTLFILASVLCSAWSCRRSNRTEHTFTSLYLWNSREADTLKLFFLIGKLKA